MDYITPLLNTKAFNCPNCGVFSQQTWSDRVQCHYNETFSSGAQNQEYFFLKNIKIAKCKHCEELTIWLNEQMVYPITGNVELPNQDLPEDIKKDYTEARNIVNLSPRGAAALLRLTLQKLCIYLGETGKNINDDIKNLVEKGLPKTIQQALDSVRVIGNNAVHPGTLDLNDNIEIASALFGFINVICETLISQPKKIKDYYQKYIPEGQRIAIEKRDGKNM